MTKRYYVCFLSKPTAHRPDHPFEVLFPAGGKNRQFDTVQEAKECRDDYRGHESSKIQEREEIGSWEVIDLELTATSPMLIVLDI